MRILLVSDPKRPDFHNYFLSHLRDQEIFLLWYYDQSDIDYDLDEYTKQGIKVIFWKSFKTPQHLIEDLKPDRIILLEIIDFWQIPLVIAAHNWKVPSFFLEHGVGNSVEMVLKRFSELPSVQHRLKYYMRKLFSRAGKILHNRLFFLSVLKYLPKKQWPNYLKLLVYYKRYTPLEALTKLKFRNRTPHFAVLFNRNNIAPFQLYNEIEDSNIITEGVPFFDKYFTSSPAAKDHLVFIDHPYLEMNLLKWSDDHHERIARVLEDFAVKRNIEIIIKLHPRSLKTNWDRYALHPLISLKQSEDITPEMLTSRLILGFSSTLINALIGVKKNIVLLGWHPEPHISGDDFSKSGLCHVSYLPEDIFARYDDWISVNRSQQNEDSFDKFIKEYNYPFDGMATQRVVRVIKEYEVN